MEQAGGDMCLAEEFMIVHQYTLNQFSKEHLVGIFEPQKPWTLAVFQQVLVLKDGERVVCRGAERLRRSVWEGN